MKTIISNSPFAALRTVLATSVRERKAVESVKIVARPQSKVLTPKVVYPFKRGTK